MDKISLFKEVAFSCNDNYLVPAQIMIQSLALNNQNTKLWLVYSDLKEDNIEFLRMTAIKNGLGFNARKVPNEIYSLVNQLPCFGYFSQEMYYRLFLPWILPQCDRILYLDCDVLIRNDISNLYFMDCGGLCLGAVPEIVQDSKRRLQLKGKYFNSGVLLLCLDKIRKKYTINQLICKIHMISEKYELIYPDQDLINIIYDCQIKELSRYFNYFAITSIKFKVLHPEDLKKAVIVHFISAKKPWKNGYCSFYQLEYWNYLKKNIPLREKIIYWISKIPAIFADIVVMIKIRLKL